MAVPPPKKFIITFFGGTVWVGGTVKSFWHKYTWKTVNNQRWTKLAVLYCNAILGGWYCIGITTFSESNNTKYWAIVEVTPEFPGQLQGETRSCCCHLPQFMCLPACRILGQRLLRKVSNLRPLGQCSYGKIQKGNSWRYPGISAHWLEHWSASLAAQVWFLAFLIQSQL